jgi:hypothetical protein
VETITIFLLVGRTEYTSPSSFRVIKTISEVLDNQFSTCTLQHYMLLDYIIITGYVPYRTAGVLLLGEDKLLCLMQVPDPCHFGMNPDLRIRTLTNGSSPPQIKIRILLFSSETF